jgi:hypothetical protein
MTVGAAVWTIIGVLGVMIGVRTISGVNFGVGVGKGVLTIGIRTIGDVSVGVGVGVLMIGVRKTVPVGVGSGVGLGVNVGSGVSFGGNVSVGVGVGVLKIGGAKVGVGTGTSAGTQPGPPCRDGTKPRGQGVGPTGGRNTPQISLPLIHCWVSPLGHDGGGGGKHDHWPLRQFGCPLGHGLGGGGLPPQT